MSWGRKYDLAAKVEQFYNQCHQDSGANGGRFCETNGQGDEATVGTNKASQAASALERGHKVNLTQKGDLSKLVKHIADNPSKIYNLCNVSVDGTPFCKGTKGIPRADMPQLKTYNPVKGSKAAALPANSKGQVDAGPAFISSLKKKGIKVTTGKENVSDIHATQDEINGARVHEVLGKAGKVQGTVYVSSDGYILDGHHHWAAKVVEGGGKLDVVKIDMPISELVKYTNDFTKEYGVPHKQLGE